MAYELIDDGEVWFPDPLVNPPDDDGFFCYGGDLSVDRLLLAYSHGIFPWYSFRWHNEPLFVHMLSLCLDLKQVRDLVWKRSEFWALPPMRA